MNKIIGYTIDENKIVKKCMDDYDNQIIILENNKNDYSYSLQGCKFGHYKTVDNAVRGYEIASENKIVKEL